LLFLSVRGLRHERLLGHSNVLDSHVDGPGDHGTRSRTHTLGELRQIGKGLSNHMDLNTISRCIEAHAYHTSPGQVCGYVAETTSV
jgi:hypothetical protein